FAAAQTLFQDRRQDETPGRLLALAPRPRRAEPPARRRDRGQEIGPAARSGVPGYAAPHRAPRRDGQALTLVADPHHFDGFGAGRRDPDHPAAIRVGLVDADDGDGARLAAPVLICDGGAETHAAAILLLRRV